MTLHEKYRPAAFDEVVGQGHIVPSLKAAIADHASHAYLFSGPSGCGKTTLARICAKELGCREIDIREVDGATSSTKEEMKELQHTMRYKPMGGKCRAVILDEAHQVSKQAFDTLLKIMEEPPSHLYWFLCTTAPEKLQTTVRTRCMSFIVKPLSIADMLSFLKDISDEEKMKTPPDVLNVCAVESGGSLRQGLVNLSMCGQCKTRREARAVLQRIDTESNTAMKDLFQLILRGGSWTKAMAIVERLQDQNPESIRIVVVNYLGSCLKNAKSDKEAVQLLSMLEAFETPYAESVRIAPLIMSIGRALFAGE